MSYTYSLEQGEESSAECFSDIPASVLSRLNLTVGKSCCNANGTASCPSSQSGTTCEHSTADLGADSLMSRAGVFPAKTSAQPEKEQALTESRAGSGQNLPESFVKWNLATCSWKTHQYSLLEGLESFSETWPRWGTMLNGECFPLPMPSGLTELRAWITSVSESGFSLPTPTSSMVTMADMEQAKFSGMDPRRPTYSQAKRLPSIRKTDADKGGRGDLIQAVRGNPNKHFTRMPTVTAQDAKNDGGPSQFERNSLPLNTIVKRMPTVTKSDGMGGPGRSENRLGGDNLRTEVGGSLNPPWVEWLLGWPVGWTDLQPLGMDKFLLWLRSHGKPFSETNHAKNQSNATGGSNPPP